uniref:Actin filament-associated protein 1-like 2 n=1 Tax=Gouania willdenowi TaxID=441366 RepID=A0A8C5HKH6_GOUWI
MLPSTGLHIPQCNAHNLHKTVYIRDENKLSNGNSSLLHLFSKQMSFILLIYEAYTISLSALGGVTVDSSYESYDEEEVSRGKSPSAQHQWPSAEASIELMKDARICAFLWRKKWLGQWGKQLCVIKDHRLLCYKSSKEQTPLLDVSLLGCTVVYKEKLLKRKEHKLKIIPFGGEAIVLGLQSKEQTEQWLKVIQEISPRPAESCEPHQFVSDSPRLICTKGELSERNCGASESGSSTDSHTETSEIKDGECDFKKYGAGLKFSNLMNIGKKKNCTLESPEKCVDTSGYLNVLVNSQWRTCWCLIKNGQLWFYQDKGKNKVSQPAVKLEGCSVAPDPNPERLYSFRIDMEGTQLATLEAKTSADMGHWLGLLLSLTGTKTDPEELTYDYVNADRISCIVNAAKTSFYLMQRRYSEPNAYIETPPSIPHNSEELYDDVASIADPEDAEESSIPDCEDNNVQKIYLDLVPVRSFLHTSCGTKESGKHPPSPADQPKNSACPNESVEYNNIFILEQLFHSKSEIKDLFDKYVTKRRFAAQRRHEPRPVPGQMAGEHLPGHVAQGSAPGAPPPRNRAHGSVEVKLGKNRTEADMRRYIDELQHLEKEREEVRSSLGKLKKERKETKEELSACQDPQQQLTLEACLKQKEEACREAENHRVEVELQLVEVKESLKKVEAGPFTLGTTLDSSLQDPPSVSQHLRPHPKVHLHPASPVNSASALKNRPASVMTTKGTVLQKAKEWEKKSST